MELTESELPYEQVVSGWTCYEPFDTEGQPHDLELNTHRIYFCDDIRKARCDREEVCRHFVPHNPRETEYMALGAMRQLCLSRGMTDEQRSRYRQAMTAVCKNICRELWETCHPVTITIREEDDETPSG